jgi:L-seryl-tRNA(Ser) seleniumtransferase
MLGYPLEDLRRRAQALAERLKMIAGIEGVWVSEDRAFVGGGSLPDQSMPAWVIEPAAKGIGDAEFALRLRSGTPAVVGRLRKEKLLLDLRTVFPRQEDDLVEAVRQAAGGLASR